jgi:mannosyltransferase OCH1-like enzyme
MIPKIIHYCWFGGNPLPELGKKCIESWKKYCPDYKIIEWNEHNFDLDINLYCKEAFLVKKWAFVTDYVRLFVIFQFGGIYMDTDVELLKPLDRFLDNPAFSGFESNNAVPTGIMAGEAGNTWYKELLDYYENKHFILSGGNFDMTTNVVIITNITKKLYNLNLDNTYQELNNELVFYPSEYFCPKSFSTGKITISNNTYCIHHFAGSWLSEHDKRYSDIRRKILKYFGENIFSQCIIRILHFIKHIEEIGLIGTMRYYYKKLFPR